MYEKINKVAIALIELTFCVLTLRSFFQRAFSRHFERHSF